MKQNFVSNLWRTISYWFIFDITLFNSQKRYDWIPFWSYIPYIFYFNLMIAYKTYIYEDFWDITMSSIADGTRLVTLLVTNCIAIYIFRGFWATEVSIREYSTSKSNDVISYEFCSIRKLVILYLNDSHKFIHSIFLQKFFKLIKGAWQNRWDFIFILAARKSFSSIPWMIFSLNSDWYL